MSNDVERLRQALRDKAQENWERGRRGAPLLSVNDAMEVLEQMGVTLPTPPRATPLEAAGDSVQRDVSGISPGRAREVASGAITAAVGALSDEAVEDILCSVTSDYTTDELAVLLKNLRAALLARLTEGGAR